MKNLLFIMTGVFPDDLSSGGKQAVYNCVDYLRNRYNTYILYKENLPISEEALSSLKREWSNVKFYSYRRDKKSLFTWVYLSIVILLKTLFRGKLYSFKFELLHRMVVTESLVKKIYQIIDDNHIDGVVTEFYPASELCYCIPEGIKKIFIQHEIRYVRNLQVIRERCYKDNIIRFLYNKSKSEEIAAMNYNDAVITLTEDDKDKLIRDGVKVPIYVSPAAIASKIKEDSFKPSENLLSYLGGASHGPNLDGVTWFLKKIWPLILEMMPNAKFQIIGNWNQEQREIFKDIKNVSFKGIVPDLSTCLPGTIMVVPLLVGSGMRMKALEGIVNKCAVVGTSIGLEGLPFKSGYDSYIENDPRSFAEKVVFLLNHPEKQNEFWNNSMKWYAKEYSKSALMQRRCEIFDKILK